MNGSDPSGPDPTHRPSGLDLALEAAIQEAPRACRDLDAAIERVRQLASEQTAPAARARRSELERIERGLRLARELIWRKWTAR